MTTANGGRLVVEPPEIEESLTKDNPGALAQVVDILLQNFESSTDSPRVKGEGTLGGTGAFPYNPSCANIKYM